MTNNLKEIEEAMSALETEKVVDLVERSLRFDVAPTDVLDALGRGVQEVGRRYEDGEYFISDLVIAGETMKKALEILKPLLKAKQLKEQAGIVLGSAYGDLHDIGKEIVKSLLLSVGLEVHDLGADVSSSKFVEEAHKTHARVIGISALLSTTTRAGADVARELNTGAVREKVKVILGGAAVRDWMVKEFGVDGAVDDAMKGLRLIQSWLG